MSLFIFLFCSLPLQTKIVYTAVEPEIFFPEFLLAPVMIPIELLKQ